jgi:hypothetical protein
VSGTIDPSPAENTIFWHARRALGATASCGNAWMFILLMMFAAEVGKGGDLEEQRGEVRE